MQTTWNLIRQGGPTMVPLLLCSVLALAVALERAWALRRARVLPPDLVRAVEALRQGDDPRDLSAACARHPSPLAVLLWPVVSTPPEEREHAIERLRTAGRRAVRQLDRGLLLLEMIAGISPLLGLFGTVLGMFETFQVIARQGLGNPGALSGGIAEALITTIAGLAIAIPTVVLQGYFSERVEGLALDLEEQGAKVLERLFPELSAALREGPP